MRATEPSAVPGAGSLRGGQLQGRVHQSLWLEMVVAATVASALMALVAGAVVLRHERTHLGEETEAVQRQLSASLTSYEPLHNLQRQLQQASSGQRVQMALVVNEQGRVLAASNNALVDLSIVQVLQQPALGPLRALFSDCPRHASAACLGRDRRLFLGPLPAIGGEAVLMRRQYPLALEGMGRFGERGTLITIGDAGPSGRLALSQALWVFLASLVPLMLGCAGLMLRLRARLIPELLALAQVDALSGVYNRRAFAEAADVILRQAEAVARPVAVALIDVDHFKRINDSLGHEAGDRVIQRVSELLRNALRGADLVGRIGGDEFVILLELPDEAATQVLRRILETVRGSAIAVHAQQPVQVTLSVGVATSLGPGAYAMEELMAAADAALYVAKDRGRNQVVNLELEARCSPEAALRREEWPIHSGSDRV